MEFFKYSSIENSYRTREVDSIRQYFPQERFLVEEKIHGSNFSLYYDGNELKCAKRSSFIGENANFFQFQKIRDENKSSLISLYQDICKEGEVLTVCGELAGGFYNHPDVEKVSGVSKVQSGVQYSPNLFFYVFDVKVNEKFLDIHQRNTLLEKHGFFYARPLFEGNLEECLKYPNDKITTIPRLLGLPDIEDNIMEGVVIKPIQCLRFTTGERVILKNKNERFGEKVSRHKHVEKVEEPMNEPLKKVYEESFNYVNENRLRNVISKIGQVTQKDFGLLQKEMNLDVLEEMEKDDIGLSGLDDADRKKFNKLIGRNCAMLIRGSFMNILDGNF